MVRSRGTLRFCVATGALAVLAPCASADAKDFKDFKVLYSFKGGADDGSGPYGGLVADGAGGFYGTTTEGGSGTGCGGNVGCGTIYEITSDGTEKVIHAFVGSDGDAPQDSLTTLEDGNFIGTTKYGGSHGMGGVFELTKDDAVIVRYSFCAQLYCSDGDSPVATVISDKMGNLFGTTEGGGPGEYGTVFKVAPNGSETVLLSFRGHVVSRGHHSGWLPEVGLLSDKDGNLYGTTNLGGDGNGDGCGTIFKLARDGTFTSLHRFGGRSDGCYPASSLIADAQGNLYGTTKIGGMDTCNAPYGCGTVFRLSPDGTETILYSFKNERDGFVPEAGLLLDKEGNLYGTTFEGGRTSTSCPHSSTCGTVFKLAPNGVEKVLHAFQDSDGSNPAAPLIMDNGRLYGTTSSGGAYGNGTVFTLRE